MKKILIFLAILIPVVLVYKNFFLGGPLAWGDAPNFSTPEIKELFSEPLSWTNRGINFGGKNLILWLSPIMILYGALNKFISLGNDLIIRILFYFPAIILAGTGSYLFSKYLKFTVTVRFFTVFLYLLNTYIILLVDGGQVGVALAYGIFPLTLLFLKRLMDSPNLNSFFTALIALTFLTLADPRITVVSIITIIIFQVTEFKIRPLKYLIPLLLCFIGVNLFWIYPLIKNSGEVIMASGSMSSIPWYYPFLLFSPHWPENLFGKIGSPSIYFLGVPLLIFFGILFKSSSQIKRIVGIFIFFAILAIGVPVINNIPLGFAFRDSTKFFAPLILFAGILIGSIAENFKILPFKFNKIISLLVYLFLLFLILPAILGKMNFVLSDRRANPDIQKVNEHLEKDPDFFRSLWIPERHPLTYETNMHSALDGNNLINAKPFSFINAGEDQFNFLYNSEFVDIARLFGVKYVVLSGNPREIAKSENDQKNWQEISDVLAKNRDLEKVDLGIVTPIYKINDSYPNIYAVKTLNAVIGQPLVNERLIPNAIYLEDGVSKPELLQGKTSEAVNLVFNNSDKGDLAMSFLQKHFKSAGEATKKEWAVYNKDQYLKYKYELLIRDVKFNDLDYTKGIAFSTVKGEKMEFKFSVKEKGEYVLISREMKPFLNGTRLKWNAEFLNLDKGYYNHIFENESGLEILNVVGLVPKNEYEKALALAEVFTKHFEVVEADDTVVLEKSFEKIETQSPTILSYKFVVPDGFRWIILNESYDPLWKNKNGTQYFESFPIFAMVNGFYIEPKRSLGQIEYLGQKNMRFGFYFSTVSVLGLIVIYLYFSSLKQVVSRK